MQLKHIPVEQIDDSQNIREMEDISELAESIDRHGLLQPIVVRQNRRSVRDRCWPPSVCGYPSHSVSPPSQLSCTTG
jgi:hypothetical protein